MIFAFGMLFVLIAILAIGGTLLTIFVSPAIALGAVLSILALEVFGYLFGVIVPLWHGKNVGKVKLNGWKKAVLAFCYSDWSRINREKWIQNLENTPRYSNICYLGTVIWMCLHLTIIAGVLYFLLYLVLYLCFLKPIGWLLKLAFVKGVYDSILKPIGFALSVSLSGPYDFLRAPLFSWMPRWVILPCLALLALYVHPVVREWVTYFVLVAFGIVGVALIILLLIAGYQCLSQSKAFQKDMYTFFRAVRDPDGSQGSKLTFWLVITLVVVLALAPMNWWYWETILALRITLEIMLIILLIVVLGFAWHNLIEKDNIRVFLALGPLYAVAIGVGWGMYYVFGKPDDVLYYLIRGASYGVVVVALTLIMFLLTIVINAIIWLSKVIKARRAVLVQVQEEAAVIAMPPPTGVRKPRRVVVRPKPKERRITLDELIWYAFVWCAKLIWKAVKIAFTYLIVKPVVWFRQVPGHAILIWVVETGDALKERSRDAHDHLCPFVKVEIK